MRTMAGDISPHDECQSRKQITGDARHGAIKRIASAMVEGSIAIELVHQYLERFDCHRTNDGQRGGDCEAF